MGKLEKKTVTIDLELIEWIEDMIKRKEFSSLSHAVQKALFRLREEYQSKKA